VYFISSNLKMYSTDGSAVQSYPGFDSKWINVKSGEEPYVQGNRIKGKDYDWLVWLIRYTGLDDNAGYAYIWDLKNSCWLQCTSGFAQNTATVDPNGRVYYGGYDGKIYKPMQEGVYADASESGAAITAYYRSGWLNPENIAKVTQVHKVEVVGAYKASGNLTLKYGYDGVEDQQTVTISQTRPLTTGQYYHRGTVCSGRGNTFQYLLYHSSAAVDTQITKLVLAGKVYGQKEQEES